jgi:hypothetical protein
MFREAAKGRGKVKELSLEDLKAVELAQSSETGGIEEIFGEVGRNDLAAAGKVRTWLQGHNGDAKPIIDAARRLVFLKGRDSHDYKFSSAVLEDFYHVSPAFREQFLAATMFQLRGAGEPDNGLVQRTRAALA